MRRVIASLALACCIAGFAGGAGAQESCAASNVGDGYCDAACNVAQQGYDGGDCCPGTCMAGRTYPCGSNGYSCVNQCADHDGDLLCEWQDLCPFDPENDADGDGLCAMVLGTGVRLLDAVLAHVDPCPHDSDNDADGDGICGNQDNCWAGANADQRDRDDDGVGDYCDNCRCAANPGQENGDRDLLGDACDVFPRNRLLAVPTQLCGH